MSNKFYYGFTLTRLIDGDTAVGILDLGFKVSLDVTLRFNGINCPESRTKDDREKTLARHATEFVADLFKDAEIEILSYGRGKFGRVIATPFAMKNDSRIDVCQALLKAGLAREYTGGKRDPWFKN